MDFNLEAGPLWQWDQLLEEIPVLPGKIPILNQQESLYVPSWKCGGHLQLPGDVMRVGADADRIYCSGELVGITNDEILLARRNVQPRKERIMRRHLDASESSFGSLPGEI